MKERVERHRQLRAVFDEALLHDLPERERYLDQACACDPALRSDVMRLLSAHSDARSFLEHSVVTKPVKESTGSHESKESEESKESNESRESKEFSLIVARGEQEFVGTERFAVRRRLGAGGMGVVYEAHDRARDEIVALKTLRQWTAGDVYRLKREFRRLADVSHPNLVCLYELVVDADQAFFTMELVKGVTFVEHARAGFEGRLLIDRLVPAFRQLVDGVTALHRMGKLHRDIKPSNVLVTGDGRVVILDFGMAAELFPHVPGGGEHTPGGTPGYSPPEEGSGAPPAEAGDWYSVGATLFETLAGRLPFIGSPLEVLVHKRVLDAPSAADVAHDVPADLSSICDGLLCRDPALRWSGRDALSRLDGGTRSGSTISGPPVTPAEAPFVGRTREVGILDEAFRTITERRPAAVYLCGASGIGKSALVRTFVARLAARPDVVVLSGRCYERESVPYKALDGVVDSLSHFLLSLPASAAESVLPHDVVALPRLFPVMRRVPAIAQACRERAPSVSEPFLLRRLAFEVLRELLVRVSRRWRVVITIDDLQWADLESALLLEELLRPPDAPALLTVVSFRSEEVAAKPFLQRLLDGADRDVWRPLRLEPMPDAEAVELVGALLPADSPLGEGERLWMTREAGGSPLVLEQLARYTGVPRTEPSRGPTFADMLETRLSALSGEARRFLETLAICGRAMAPELVCHACGVSRDRQSLVAMLRAFHFIRSSGSSERIELYHDRIREVLAARMVPDAVRHVHGLMVQALVERRIDDCEALFEHYRGAGDAENASIQAGLAAVKASAALAFDRAASFYRHALALAPSASTGHEWKERLAAALAHAGRPAEAAEAYLSAAAGAGHARHVELQRRGAEQFLIGGHIDRGLDVIRTVLADVGLRPARSPRAALGWLLWRRARLRWRGLRYVSKPADHIDADTLLRVDTCWSAATGLALVDIISASDFSARHLHMALDAGEPSRLARAMALESVARAATPTGRRSSARLAEQSKALSTSAGNPHTVAVSILADGMSAVAVGEWKRALALSEHALAILRDQCVGFSWESNIAENLVIWALMYLGELQETSRRVPVLLADARARGNLYLATELCTRANLVWLAADDPDEGERETVESIGRWSQSAFHRQHYSAMLSRVQTALYRGQGHMAWRLLAEQEARLRRSCLTRVQAIRIEWLYLRGRSALAMAARDPGSRRFLSVARACARRIAGERMPWSDPLALLIQAGVAHLEGSTPQALRCLHDAAGRFERGDMKLYLGATWRRIGALQDDMQGRGHSRDADAWMAAQGIKNPACMTRMLTPGFPDA